MYKWSLNGILQRMKKICGNMELTSTRLNGLSWIPTVLSLWMLFILQIRKRDIIVLALLIHMYQP
ncbi:hypothetical protein LEP1GSC185_3865 [Leptospira licerasiae serovar Varillal str. VAR 010]|uniref:Uncharacterized protein n=1 Tax=Leptospira licerasiae str. MMD4847 TaxID=1049971 RepID=A0ABN0HEM1_9LEPT|nr:hypothetical protein LEP1GSC185_3865 [Leptospira licerasiae serovar Varillal str. VAR 010]EJZ43932.1 hypothetical protein LEP1GSC178_2026 [Leptospira licerasiae str. MMD4847]